MRTAQRLAPAALALALSACSYPAEPVGLTVEVDNIPAQANSLLVTVVDPAGGTKTYHPSFGPGSYSLLQLSFAPPSTTGMVTVTVQAQDAAKTDLADGSNQGDYPPTAVPFQVSLSVPPGTFGEPCVAGSGGPNTCNSPLICLAYNAGDLGVCTQACTNSCPTPPTGSTSPASTCLPFGSPPVNDCQWDCTPPPGGSNGPCPPDLVCKVTSGGKSFCS